MPISLLQALVYLRWVRFAIEHVLVGRSYVILNMDETSLSTVEDQSRGLRTCYKSQNSKNLKRQRDDIDRSNGKTSLLATVCDSHDLQPYLPQILLVRYTRNTAPPAHLLNAFAATGEPLEYWHGTGGWASSETIKMWATRMRSLIHSFNPDAWILLVWDCSQTHLNLDVTRHLRRLGILVIYIPAKLTPLLQVCDVCVFKELKTRIRILKTSIRCKDATGRLRPGDWIASCGAAIREVIVDRCWEDAFERMGLGATIDTVEGRVKRTVPPNQVQPRLPSRAEFGRMVNRSPETEGLRELYESIVRPFLTVNDLPPDAAPRTGAIVPIPDIGPAKKRFRISEAVGMDWEEAMDRELDRIGPGELHRPHGRADAVQRTLAARETV